MKTTSAKKAMEATKGQITTHLHHIGFESGKIVEVETIRSRMKLGKELRGLEEVGAEFQVDGTTIWVR